ATSRYSPFSTLFPYTTLFRSVLEAVLEERLTRTGARRRRLPFHLQRHCVRGRAAHGCHNDHRAARSARRYQTHVVHTCDRGVRRSEEHTSELQSRENLVCRLL